MSPAAGSVAQHPEVLRARSLTQAPGAPWVTYYDGSSVGGGRIELSATTLDNWVAKAGNLLAEEYDIGPGSVVRVALGCHWLLHVWTWSTWALGATVALATPDLPVDVWIGGPELLPVPTDAPLLACPTDPLARPLGARTPPGAVDVMADIHGYPDAIALPPPDPAAVAVRSGTGALTFAAAVRAAERLAPATARRLLLQSAPTSADMLLFGTLTGATRGGSTVLVPNTAEPDVLARICEQEHVDAPWRNPDRI